MHRIVPSQAVQIIDKLFSQFKDQVDSQGGRVALYPNDVGRVRAVLDVIESIPADLISLNPDDHARFIVATSVLKNQVDEWTARGNIGKLERVPGFGDLNPITIIRRALAFCRDEPIHASSGDLSFITPADLRDNIWADVTAIHRALSNQEWKATTVLAGSALEALLLWGISTRKSSDVDNAISSLVGNGELSSKPDPQMERWILHQYIYVAHSLTLIADSSKTQMLLAKEFRNLIHPGRSVRLAQTCDRGTALASVAAIEHAIRDLRNST